MKPYHLMAFVQSPEVYASVEMALRECACQVDCVQSEADATQRLQDENWDAILLEVRSLPQAIAHCIHLRQYSNRPVIALLSYPMSGEVVKGYEAGFDAHIIMPFDSREFVARVHAILRRVHARRTMH